MKVLCVREHAVGVSSHKQTFFSASWHLWPFPPRFLAVGYLAVHTSTGEPSLSTQYPSPLPPYLVVVSCFMVEQRVFEPEDRAVDPCEIAAQRAVAQEAQTAPARGLRSGIIEYLES